MPGNVIRIGAEVGDTVTAGAVDLAEASEDGTHHRRLPTACHPRQHQHVVNRSK